MTTSTEWQLGRAAAERYQHILTPTILGPFAKALVDFAALQPGERVADVGCGTGAVARYAAAVISRSGS
jgi:ubiquinone/menaquinone biosynthesis C-methylase UbiE